MIKEIWDRYYELQIETQAFTINDFDIEWKIKNDNTGNAGDAEISVYNLSTKTRRKFKKGEAIQLKAGYIKDHGVIFIGTIDEVKDELKRADIKTTVQVLDAETDLFQGGYLVKSYAEGTKPETIIQDMFTHAGISTGKIEETGIVLKTGMTFQGSPYEIIRTCELLTNGEILKNAPVSLKAIAEADHITRAVLMVEWQEYKNKNWFSHHIRKNTGYFVKGAFKDEAINAIVISSETGLLHIMSAEDKDKKMDYRIKTLLNWKINQETLLSLDSRNVTGLYKVIAYKHVCSGDEYYTEMDIKAVVAT